VVLLEGGQFLDLLPELLVLVEFLVEPFLVGLVEEGEFLDLGRE